MAPLTGRQTGLIQIDTGLDVTDIATEWNMRLSSPPVEVTPLTSPAPVRSEGDKDWEMTITKFIDSVDKGILVAAFNTGGTVQASIKEAASGNTYSGGGLITQCNLSSGGRNAGQTESVTIVCADGALLQIS